MNALVEFIVDDILIDAGGVGLVKVHFQIWIWMIFNIVPITGVFVISMLIID